MEAQMQIHQLRDVVDHLFGIFQGTQPLSSHLGTDHLMVVEADSAVWLMLAGGGLADVVQQRRPAQNQIGPSSSSDRLA
jgi:hypothetical protein